MVTNRCQRQVRLLVTFNGSSTYSSAFQQVITRAVGIASLPMQSLQTPVTTLTSQQSSLSALGTDFGTFNRRYRRWAPRRRELRPLRSPIRPQSAPPLPQARCPEPIPFRSTILGSSTVTLSQAGSPPVTDPTTGNISSSSTFTLTVNNIANTITPPAVRSRIWFPPSMRQATV